MAVDIKKYLGVAKKNGAIIAAVAVSLAAVAVPFMVADKWVAETETNLKASEQKAASVRSLLTKERKLPITDPDATEAPKLEIFPNKAQIDVGNAAEEQMKKGVTDTLNVITTFENHKPLVPEVFSASLSTYAGAAYRFRDKYMNEAVPDGLTKLIKGGMPDRQEDVTAAVAAELARITQDKSIRQGGTVINQAEVDALKLKAQADIPLRMRNNIAERNPVYVSRDTWQVATNFPPGGVAPSADVVWFAQLGYWIQEDVAKIVVAANGNSAKVATSPVKHLVKVIIPQNPYLLNRSTGEGATGLVPVTKVDPATAITLNPAYGLTGRSGNGLYDVVRYQMVVRVSAAHVAEFLAEIPRKRLHYVLKFDLRAIDSASEALNGFTYGTDPVVELIIDCESLYLRKWEDGIMPKVVKQMVGIEEPAPIAAPVGGE